MKRKSLKSVIVSLLIIVLYFANEYYQTNHSDIASNHNADENHAKQSDNQQIEYLFSQRISGEMIIISGKVIKLLADDLEGSRHQKFIIELDNDMTILVTHNIDLAPRVKDLSVGDLLELYGQYEWNSRGGILHWTHHDPNGRHQDGWIKHQRKTYQ